MMMMHKCARGMASLLHVRKGAALPCFGPTVPKHLLQSHFCHGSTAPPFLESTKPGLKIMHLNPQVTHRGFTGESLVPSFGDPSKRSKKPVKRIKVAEQGKVYGNLRSNLGLEKSGWDDLQLSAYGASNEVVFSHLDEHFQDIVDIRTFSSQAWEELKEDIEGFPFNGRTLNRTNVESCLLHYLRHTSNLQLAASFSAYLRENGGLQPFHYKQLLALYIDVESLNDAEDEVKQLCQPVLSEGPGSVYDEPLYWLAVQAMAKTSAWKEVLESALKHFEASPATSPAGNNSCREGSLGAFSTLIQQALKAGECTLAVRMAENPEFHRHLVPLRRNLQKKHQEYLDDVLIAWVEHCAGLGSLLERESALVKLVEYLGRRGLLINDFVEEAIFQFCQGDQKNLSAKRATISSQGHCSSCGTSLSPYWQEGKEFNLLHKEVLEAVLHGKDIYQSTYPKELEEFLKMVGSEGPFDVVIDGLNIAFSRTPGRYKDMQSRGQPGRLESLQVLDVVNYFCDAGLRVLVVTRGRAKFYKDYRKICQRARVHLLNKVTEDDPYILLAALQSGPSCKIVTNDLLRQHFHLLWRLDPELGKAFTEWQVSHQVIVPAYRAYARNMPPESIHFTAPVIVNPPKHALTASHSPPFFHLPLAPNREDQVLTSLALPSQWICLGPPPNSELCDSGVTNKKASKFKFHKHVGSTMHNIDGTDQENVKNINDKCDKVETEANELETPSRHWSREGLEDNSQCTDRDWPLVKGGGAGKVGRVNVKNEDGDEWREAGRSSAMEQKRSYSRAGGRKEGRQSWPFEGGDWPEAAVKEEEKKRSWSRVGGRKDGRQSWPFEGGDWPEADPDRRKWSNRSNDESNRVNDRHDLEAERDDIGGKVEDVSAHWSQRKLPDPPKVQFEDKKQKQRYVRKQGGFQDQGRKRREAPPPDF